MMNPHHFLLYTVVPCCMIGARLQPRLDYAWACLGLTGLGLNFLLPGTL